MFVSSLFAQLLGNGLVQGAVAMLYAAGFGIVYRSFRVFHIAMGAQFVFSCYAFYTCAAVCKLPLTVSVPYSCRRARSDPRLLTLDSSLTPTGSQKTILNEENTI